MFFKEEGNPFESIQNTSGLITLDDKTKDCEDWSHSSIANHPGDQQHQIYPFLNFPSTFGFRISNKAGCEEHALHGPICIPAEQLSCMISHVKFQSGS